MTFPQRLGAFCWMAAGPVFLLANVIVGFGWEDPAFSWADHNISDLGNVTCGVWDTTRPRYVCSPWHDAMNVALVLTSVLLVAGLLLTRPVRPAPRTGDALLLLGAAGLGLAGAFPADIDENLHVLGALLVFAFGNAGLLVVGCSGRARFRRAALGLGVLGLTGSVLFLAQQDAGLGLGGMERVAVFPLSVWTCVAGCHLGGEALANWRDRRHAVAAR